MRRPDHRRRAIEALDALDRSDLRVTGSACPGVHSRRLIAGVDRELGKAKLRAVRMRPRLAQQSLESFQLPDFSGPPSMTM